MAEKTTITVDGVTYQFITDPEPVNHKCEAAYMATAINVADTPDEYDTVDKWALIWHIPDDAAEDNSEDVIDWDAPDEIEMCGIVYDASKII